MLKVTIEIVPYGVEANKRTLYEIDIINVGTNRETNIADYHIREHGEFKFRVKDFDRGRGSLALVQCAINAYQEVYENDPKARRNLYGIETRF